MEFYVNFTHSHSHLREEAGGINSRVRLSRQNIRSGKRHKLFSSNIRGYAVAQLVKALCYKPEGRGFDSRWCRWNFSLPQSFRPNSVPGVVSASNRNAYQEYFLEGKGDWCVGLTTLPPSFANCLEIWEPQPPGTLRPLQACTEIGLPLPLTIFKKLTI